MLDVIRPTLLLNKDISVSNIKKLKKKVDKYNIILRPHFKTHQSIQVGEWYRDEGIKKITVSSVTMAKYFSDDWDDIMIAFPINILEIDTLNSISKRCKISLIVDSFSVISHLDKNLFNRVNIYIKIDVGYRRAGIIYDNFSDIGDIINFCSTSKVLSFKGFVSHFGNTYNSNGKKEIISTYNKSLKKLKDLNDLYPEYEISIGDTPSSSLVDHFPEFVSELRPGNFIFYDLFQYSIGSCDIKDIAVRMVCPIVSVYKDRGEVLIYGGSVHFSKDFIDQNKNKSFGYAYKYEDIWKERKKAGFIKSLSQEHGIISVNNVENYRVGDLLAIIPIHSCLTVDKMGSFFVDQEKLSIMRY
tara:strand:- start:4597 stop:5667 length:1071 start_codon:yes stop_codon:yes gene_type:complete